MNAIRAFIAIDLPSSIQARLRAVISELDQPPLSAVRWVTAQNIHLTLKFLGDISPSNLEMLCKQLEADTARYASFGVKVAGLGAFPNPRRPRVIWVGIHAPQALVSLQKAIESSTHRLGYATEDRAFSPHLTLGRVAHNASPAEVQQIADRLATMQVGELGEFAVNEVLLYRSDLKPGGAIYSQLFHTTLKTA